MERVTLLIQSSIFLTMSQRSISGDERLRKRVTEENHEEDRKTREEKKKKKKVVNYRDGVMGRRIEGIQLDDSSV